MNFLDSMGQVIVQSPIYAVLFIVSIIIILLLYRLDIIVSLVKKHKEDIPKDKHTEDILSGKAITINSNILIYLFEIHTHYRDALAYSRVEVRSKQFDYAEQIIEQIIDESCKKYRSEQEKSLSDLGDVEAIKEFLLFKESLRSAFYVDVMRLFRMSFKKNGYCELSDTELKEFAKGKTNVIMSSISKHLSVYFPIFNEMNIRPNFLMDTIIDGEYIEKSVLGIYKNAVELKQGLEKIEDNLRNEFQRSINTLMLQSIFEIEK